MSNWNGYLKCIDNNISGLDHKLTIGKIYEVKNGEFIYDNGSTSHIYRDYHEFISGNLNMKSKMIEYKKGENRMRKEDIKAGMIVEVRNGNRYVMMGVGNELVPSRVGSYIDFSHNNDLTYPRNSDFDICKVYKTEYPWRILDDILEEGMITLRDCELIWSKDSDVIKVGDEVAVIENGQQYRYYENFLRDYFPDFLGRFAYGVKLENGDEFEVVAFGNSNNSYDELIYVLRNIGGQVFLIGENGIKKIGGGR